MSRITITVEGPVGSGKSALCGEIEILCKALGVPCVWEGGRSEKNLTGADWVKWIEFYEPNVVIKEVIQKETAQ